MKLLITILLLFTAGCASLRAPEPAAPAAPQARAGEQAEQPAVQPKAAEPGPAVTAEPSQPIVEEEISVARTEPGPALQKQRKPSLALKEPPVPDSKLHSLTRLAESNDEKILNVYAGMYRKTVEGIMGTVQNPYKHQRITAPDGKVYEILFYLTREPRKGKPITDRMLTPIIFRKGQVAAIGNYHLKRLIRTGTLGRQKPPKEVAE